LLWLGAAGLLSACAATSTSGPMAGAPLSRLSIYYDAPARRDGPIVPPYVFVGPPLPPELEASVRFTLPSLLATHGVQVVPYAPDTPVLAVYLLKLVKMCNGTFCSNSVRVAAQLIAPDGRSLWSRDTWVDDDAYEAPGQKEMFRQLVADMSRDKVIPAAVQVPERSFVVVTEAPGPDISVRNYAVRFSRSGTGDDFKLSSERTLRQVRTVGLDWHGGELLAGNAAKAVAAAHAVLRSVSAYPAGLAPGCDDGARGNLALVNADVLSVLRERTAASRASYGLFISARPLPAEDELSPLNDTGLFVADAVDDSGLMKFSTTPRGAAHRESNLITPYCAVFYDATADAAILSAWRPTRPVQLPSKYYDSLDGIGEALLPSLAREFDANLGGSLDQALPTFIERMTP
jgi:hypothetical protein